jgi:hypothetical protein
MNKDFFMIDSVLLGDSAANLWDQVEKKPIKALPPNRFQGQGDVHGLPTVPVCAHTIASADFISS